MLNLMIVAGGNPSGLLAEAPHAVPARDPQALQPSKEDDVRKYVSTYRRDSVRHGQDEEQGAQGQRLVTAHPPAQARESGRRRRRPYAQKPTSAGVHKLLALRLEETRERRSGSLAAPRLLRR